MAKSSNLKHPLDYFRITGTWVRGCLAPFVGEFLVFVRFPQSRGSQQHGGGWYLAKLSPPFVAERALNVVFPPMLRIEPMACTAPEEDETSDEPPMLEI